MALNPVEIVLRANTARLERDFAQAGRSARELDQALRQSMRETGQQVQKVGAALVGLGVAALATGKKAVGLGNEFETNMAKITGLVGIASDEVKGMQSAVLDLAGETATAPQELSDALFTVTSAGLRGNDAMEALEVAAKGSAAGMGETRSVAQALSGVMNAYAASGINAAEAGDFLAATARAGNFEVSELAGSLGRVLPTASNLGVAIEDVGGAIALLTRNGLSASEAVTQTNAVMRAFLAPSGEAQKIADDLGFSFDDVRSVLQEDGLIAALGFMEDATGGNSEQLVKLVGGSEAAGAAFSLLGADAETLEGTFGTVANASGVLDEAFGAVAETNAFKMKQSMTEITTALTEIGLVVAQVVAPVLKTLATAVTAVAKVFTSLPGPLQATLVGFGAMLIPVGGLTMRYGQLIEKMARLPGAMGKTSVAGKMLGGHFSKLQGAVTRLGAGLPVLGAAVVAAGIAYKVWSDRKREARERADQLTEAVKDQEGSVPALSERIAELNAQYGEMTEETEGAEGAVSAMGAEMDNFIANLTKMGKDGGTEAFAGLSRHLREQLVPAMQTGTDEFEELQGALGDAMKRGLEGEEAMAFLQERFEHLEGPIRDVIMGLIDETDMTREGMKAAQDMVDVLDETADSYDDVGKAQKDKLKEDILEAQSLGLISDAYAEQMLERANSVSSYADMQNAQTDLIETQERTIAAHKEAADAEMELNAVRESGSGAAQRFRDAQDDVADSTEDAGDAASRAERDFTEIAKAAEEFADEARAVAEESGVMAMELGGVEKVLGEVDGLLNEITGTQKSYDEAVFETLDTMHDFTNEIWDQNDGYRELGENVSTAEALQTSYGRKAIEAARETAEAIQDEMLARIANGESIEDVTDIFDGQTASLREQLRAIGLNEDSINELIETYAGYPEELLAIAEVETQEAKRKSEEMVELLLAYGELTPEAWLEANPELAEANLAAVLLELEGFDAETAEAKLQVGTATFDEEFAARVLALEDFDATEVAALLNGEDEPLQEALETAIENLNGFDTTVYTTTVGADPAPFDSTMETARIDAGAWADASFVTGIGANPEPFNATMINVETRGQGWDTATYTAQVSAATNRAALAGVESDLESTAMPTSDGRISQFYSMPNRLSRQLTVASLDAVAKPFGKDREAIFDPRMGSSRDVRVALEGVRKPLGRHREAWFIPKRAAPWDALAALERVRKPYGRHREAWFLPRVSSYSLGIAEEQLRNLARTRYSTIVVSTTSRYAEGGIRDMPSGSGQRPPAGVFDQPTAIFGEAGPEAFIPLSPERRQQSLPILAEAANRLGTTLMLARGGVLGGDGVLHTGPSSSVGRSSTVVGDTTYNVTINNPEPEKASTSLPLAMRRMSQQSVPLEPTRMSRL